MSRSDNLEQADPLDRLVGEIRQCRLCRDKPTGAPLPHEPRPVLRVSRTARICVCGQAPGTRVHASGTPFTDPSGDRLRAWMGVTPEEFYDEDRIAIIPMGFCFPGLDEKGGDRPPRPECAATWRASLFEHLPQFELILLVGHHAQRWHLGKRAARTLSETVENWRSYLVTDDMSSDKPRATHLRSARPADYLPLPHPSWRNNAWLKKNPWFEAEVLPYLRSAVRRLLGAHA